MRSYLIVWVLIMAGCIGVNRNVGYPPKKKDNISQVTSTSTVATVSSSNTAPVNSPSVSDDELERQYHDHYLNGEVF